MLVKEKTSIYLAIELSLREISYVLCARAHLRALMTQNSCAVGMRNAKLENHLKLPYILFWNDENNLFSSATLNLVLYLSIGFSSLAR